MINKLKQRNMKYYALIFSNINRSASNFAYFRQGIDYRVRFKKTELAACKMHVN